MKYIKFLEYLKYLKHILFIKLIIISFIFNILILNNDSIAAQDLFKGGAVAINSGDITPLASNTHDLGTVSLKWRNLYLTNTLEVDSLSLNSGVYTDGFHDLTSTPPSSGTLGFWSRAGTVLTPSTSGDSITIAQNGLIKLFNTVDQVTDFEDLFIKWDTNIAKIGTEKGGGGTARNLEIDFGGGSLLFSGSNGREITYTAASAPGYIHLVGGNFTITLGNVVNTLSLPPLSTTSIARGFELDLYNTTDQVTNYEDVFFKWDSSIFKIGTEKGGSGTQRSMEFIAGNNGGTTVPFVFSGPHQSGASLATFASTTQVAQVDVDTMGANPIVSGFGFRLNGVKYADIVFLGANGDARDNSIVLDNGGSANLFQIIGTTGLPQTVTIYNTGYNNYERSFFRWDSNIFKIGTEISGSGTLRDVAILPGTGLLGINNSTPNSGLQITGSVAYSRITDSADADYTVLATDHFIILNKANPHNAILPDPSSPNINGREYIIKNAGIGTQTVTTAAGLIDNGASVVLITNASVSVFTDGTNYWIF